MTLVMKMTEFHIITKNDNYFIFHPASMGLFSVSESAGKFLNLYESKLRDNTLIPCDGIIDRLDIKKILNYLNEFEKIHIIKDLKWDDIEPKTLYLIISQDCNLRCSYCFADHGTFGGTNKFMTISTAKNCINKLLGNKFNNFIVFFGGEPFLNFSLMKEIEDYRRQIGLEIKYTTITNGTVMNDAIESFIIDNLFHLSVSLDGPKELNDKQRHGNRVSAHDQAVMTINRFKNSKLPLTIKCTATKNSIGKLESIAEYLFTLGATSIAFAPVSRIPQECELFISDSEFAIYAQELSNLLVRNINQMASGGITTEIVPIFKIITQLVTKTRVIHHCSAGRETLAVTADGDVYPCHEFVGMAEFKLGNVNDEAFPGEDYNRIKSIFNNHSIYTIDECRSCWARFICGGDCPVRSYIHNGDLFRPRKEKCIWIKSILEALLPEIAEIFQDKYKLQNLMKQFNTRRR